VRAVKFELNGEYGIYVEDRGKGKWAVTYGGMCLGRNGEWDYEPMPSSRTDEWIAANRFDSPEEAERAFKDHKPRLRINGRTIE
jgi:hypothetical protein